MNAEKARKLAEAYRKSWIFEEVEEILAKIEDSAKVGGTFIILDYNLDARVIDHLKGERFVVTNHPGKTKICW